MFSNQNHETSVYEISWILLTVRYIAVDHLTWNDPCSQQYVIANYKSRFLYYSTTPDTSHNRVESKN